MLDPILSKAHPRTSSFLCNSIFGSRTVQIPQLRNDRGFRIHQKDVAARNIIRNTVMLSITNASRNKYIILYSQGGSSDHPIVSMDLCLFASFE